jgi:hypothetical protein
VRLCLLRFDPDGCHVSAGEAIVDEAHGQVGDDAVVVAHAQVMVAGEGAEHADFHVPEIGQRLQAVQLGGRHGHNHALLRF